MSSGYTVAIVGGTGTLGHNISDAFLTTFRSSFPHVRVLTRNPASEKAKKLKAKGAELFPLGNGDVNQALDTAFAGTDVIVDAFGEAPVDIKHSVVQALARSSAKVFFLSEYGSDHRINEFNGYEHPAWLQKQELDKETRKVAQGKKVIALYTSLFFEVAFASPFLGIDIANNKFTAYGDPKQKAAFISTVDVGKAIARLSILALDPTTAGQVRDHLRIAGDTVSFEDIRDTVARVKGVAPGTIKSEDLAKKKEEIRQHPGENFLEYLRVVVGEGKAEFAENDNELVNPGEKFWKWRRVEDLVREL